MINWNVLIEKSKINTTTSFPNIMPTTPTYVYVTH